MDSADIEDDRLIDDELRTIHVEQTTWTEKHLLRPYDVLVTARSHKVKIALVPPSVTRTVASATLLVLRPHSPERGFGHYLWYFLTSTQGRARLERRVQAGASIPVLSGQSLAELEVPPASDRVVDQIAKLVEASEAAYDAAIEAAGLRRGSLRDGIIQSITEDKSRENDLEPTWR